MTMRMTDIVDDEWLMTPVRLRWPLRLFQSTYEVLRTVYYHNPGHNSSVGTTIIHRMTRGSFYGSLPMVDDLAVYVVSRLEETDTQVQTLQTTVQRVELQNLQLQTRLTEMEIREGQIGDGIQRNLIPTLRRNPLEVRRLPKRMKAEFE
ncbi:hypothetical protein Tco_0840284 [Tanacetum coccineum]|uniref:Uncharacterized protein n=1 Tax=Tanacetum coccineum TaxID=301880 RepID=A0ABQ5AVM4_9ASTR